MYCQLVNFNSCGPQTFSDCHPLASRSHLLPKHLQEYNIFLDISASANLQQLSSCIESRTIIFPYISYVFTRPLRTSKMWYKVIFKQSLTGLNLRLQVCHCTFSEPRSEPKSSEGSGEL